MQCRPTYKILLILAVFTILLPSHSFELIHPAQANSVQLTGNLKHYVYDKALEYGVDPKLALYIVENESSFNPNALGDMNIFIEGQPVESRGLWQISKLYWPEITDEMAYDIEWSTNWSLDQIKKGNCNLWTTCRKYGAK